jgi:two-component system sensor histidine kinase KdpD
MEKSNAKRCDEVNNESRPNPDSLLDLVNHDRSVSSRGRLKVFFGASAGVGKTYAMLLEARRRLADGLDVVIGVVETHGRSETANLVKGIPTIAPRTILHRGVELQEFDLEAALERKPSLILMDEFAHTNAPTSRHPKRWQDVEELLSHGIDVYTTLNVQHLESINDMVAKLTGILVRETVPDSIFDASDDIALIDIPSDEFF